MPVNKSGPEDLTTRSRLTRDKIAGYLRFQRRRRLAVRDDTRSIIGCAGLLARRGRGAIEVRSRRCRSRTSAAGVRAGIADGRYGNRDNPVTPGPPPSRRDRARRRRRDRAHATLMDPAPASLQCSTPSRLGRFARTSLDE